MIEIRAYNRKKKPKHITTHRYKVTPYKNIIVTSKDSKPHTMAGNPNEELYNSIGDFIFYKYEYHSYNYIVKKNRRG